MSERDQLQVFKNSEFGELEIREFEGKIYFPASDCAKLLGYSNPRKAVIDHCKGVTKCDTLSEGGVQEKNYIPEGDLYRLITSSKLPTAEKFEKWVFDEILPAIRKTGGFSMKTPEPTAILTQIRATPKNLQRPDITLEDRIRIMELMSNCSADALPYLAALAKPFMPDDPDVVSKEDATSEKRPANLPYIITPKDKKSALSVEKSKKQPTEDRKRSSNYGCDIPFNSKRLRDHMHKLGLTINALAIKSDIDCNCIWKYLNGYVAPGIENRARMCKALGKPANWLNGGAK
jgi:prophage antirepressor-like protein